MQERVHAKDSDAKYIITPVGRLSYINVWQPRKRKENEQDKAPVYDTVLILDKPSEMDLGERKRYQALKTLIEETKQAKWPKLKTAVASPFRHGFEKSIKPEEGYLSPKPFDLDNNPEYRDKVIIKAVSYNRPPQVLRPNKDEMMNQNELYSGCYARLWVTAFAYDNAGNKGISFGLQGILKVRDGEPLSFSRRAEDAFAEIQVDEDDFKTVEDDQVQEEEEF